MKLPQINEINATIENCSIYLRSTHKWGKSTLFRDLIIEKYGDPSYGLCVACGAERASTMLDASNTVKVETYEDALDLKSYLIDKIYIERDSKGKIVSKTPIEHNIKIVSFDVVDELFPAFEKRAIQVSNKENPTKPCKTINGAFSGRHNGQFYTADLMKKYMTELIDAGFGVWALSHSKYKTIKDKGGLEEDGYDQLTSSLMSTYDGVFANIFDVILTGVIDRDIETEEVSDGNGGTKKKKHVNAEVRKLYFRGTTAIDAGGRFAPSAVPEFMVFDADKNNAAEFITIVEEGMEKSKTNFSKPKAKPQPTKKEIEEPIKVESDPLPEGFEDETNDMFDDVLEETATNEYPEDLFEVIKGSIKTLPKDKKLIVAKKVKEFGTLKDVPEEGLKEIWGMINE